MVRGIVGRDGAWRAVVPHCAIAAGFPACRAMAAGFLRHPASRLRAGRHDPGWLPGAMAAVSCGASRSVSRASWDRGFVRDAGHGGAVAGEGRMTSWQSRLPAQAMSRTIRPVTAHAPITPLTLRGARWAIDRAVAGTGRLPAGTTWRRLELPACGAELVRPADPAAVTVLYFHGGGFIAGSARAGPPGARRRAALDRLRRPGRPAVRQRTGTVTGAGRPAGAAAHARRRRGA
ncbi:hypothetical protein [Amycolatopsis thermoflava]|uniref:hypothetical protein n=1 Tax=Amycolatopsis thermoflava TaxID=84480 RepID=UPI003EBC4151